VFHHTLFIINERHILFIHPERLKVNETHCIIKACRKKEIFYQLMAKNIMNCIISCVIEYIKTYPK